MKWNNVLVIHLLGNRFLKMRVLGKAFPMTTGTKTRLLTHLQLENGGQEKLSPILRMRELLAEAENVVLSRTMTMTMMTQTTLRTKTKAIPKILAGMVNTTTMRRTKTETNQTMQLILLRVLQSHSC